MAQTPTTTPAAQPQAPAPSSLAAGRVRTDWRAHAATHFVRTTVNTAVMIGTTAAAYGLMTGAGVSPEVSVPSAFVGGGISRSITQLVTRHLEPTDESEPPSIGVISCKIADGIGRITPWLISGISAGSWVLAGALTFGINTVPSNQRAQYGAYVLSDRIPEMRLSALSKIGNTLQPISRVLGFLPVSPPPAPAPRQGRAAGPRPGGG